MPEKTSRHPITKPLIAAWSHVIELFGGPSEHPSRPRISNRSTQIWLGVVSVASASTVIFGNGLGNGFNVLGLVVALVGFAWLMLSAGRRQFNRKALWVVAICLTAVAVLFPPRGSKDVTSYAMYGHMVAEYSANPYEHTPVEFPTDPYAPDVSRRWINTPSVYGPVFTVVSAGGMTVAGESKLASRLFFQGIAATSFVAILLLIDRRVKDNAALAFCAINPIFTVIGINGGHNDLIVAALVCAASFLAVDKRWVWTGSLIGIAALVKLTGGLALVAMGVWALCRFGRRAAALVVGSGAAIVAAGYFFAGGLTAVKPLMEAGKTNLNNATIWSVPQRWLISTLVADGETRYDARVVTNTLMGRLAGVTLLVLLALVIASRRKLASPALATGGAFLAFCFTTPWLLPWYVAPAMPQLAQEWRSRMSRLAVVWMCFWCIAYVREDYPTGWLKAGAGAVYWAMPLVNFVAVGLLVWFSLSALRAERHTAQRASAEITT